MWDIEEETFRVSLTVEEGPEGALLRRELLHVRPGDQRCAKRAVRTNALFLDETPEVMRSEAGQLDGVV
jgi:hypothetical protein